MKLVRIRIAFFLFSLFFLISSSGNAALPPGKWEVLVQGSSRIYYESPDETNARNLNDWLSVSLPDFAEKLEVSVPENVSFFIAPNQPRFRVLTRGLPEWTGGVVYPEKRVVVLLSPRMQRDPMQFKITALHESVHLITELDGKSNLPKWLSEGMAMYLSGETMYKQRIPLARAVVLNKTFTLDEVDDVLHFGQSDATVAYLQSINAVEYFIHQYGWKSMAALVRGFRAGEQRDLVFRRITGGDFFDFEHQWYQSLKSKYRWWKFIEWFDIQTTLWTSASILVLVVGGITLYRRRQYFKESRTGADKYDSAEFPPESWSMNSTHRGKIVYLYKEDDLDETDDTQ